jgi:hypothetical protein
VLCCANTAINVKLLSKDSHLQNSATVEHLKVQS